MPHQYNIILNQIPSAPIGRRRCVFSRYFLVKCPLEEAFILLHGDKVILGLIVHCVIYCYYYVYV